MKRIVSLFLMFLIAGFIAACSDGSSFYAEEEAKIEANTAADINNEENAELEEEEKAVLMNAMSTILEEDVSAGAISTQGNLIGE